MLFETQSWVRVGCVRNCGQFGHRSVQVKCAQIMRKIALAIPTPFTTDSRNAVYIGYSLRYPIYIWDIQIGYRFPGPPYAIVFAYTDTCETLGRSGRTLRVILSGKSELGNLIRAQQRSRRALAARWHCVGGAVAATMAGSWWDSP